MKSEFCKSNCLIRFLSILPDSFQTYQNEQRYVVWTMRTIYIGFYLANTCFQKFNLTFNHQYMIPHFFLFPKCFQTKIGGNKQFIRSPFWTFSQTNLLLSYFLWISSWLLSAPIICKCAVGENTSPETFPGDRIENTAFNIVETVTQILRSEI